MPSHTSAIAALLLAASMPLQAEPTGERIRADPAELASMATSGPGAGSSGVSGIRTLVLKGDPSKPGLYTILLQVPPHTTIQAHRHPDDRVATVVAGTWNFGYGVRFDAAALKALPPGSFYTEPAGEPHYARTTDSAVSVQITGVGPTGTVYENPADTPRSSAQ